MANRGALKFRLGYCLGVAFILVLAPIVAMISAGLDVYRAARK